MTTVRQLIGSCHRLLGLADSGNVLPEAVYQDNLDDLNTMLDGWSIERLSIYNTIDQVVVWPASTASGTLGPSGTLALVSGGDAVRPVLVDDATYFVDASTGISYGIKLINQQQYDGIAVKTVTSTYPQVMWVNMSFPDISMTVYPVPTKALQFHVISVEVLSQVASLSTDLSLPPGYERALKYNLACEIATTLNVDPPRQVMRIADVSKRALKRINNPDDIMSIPYSIVATRQRYNIFAGNY